MRPVILLAVLASLVVCELCGAANTVGHNQRLKSNLMLRNKDVMSDDGRFRFVMQGDCNLVLYQLSDNKALWASRTNGKGRSCYALMQGNGNLVVFNDDDVAVWDSDTIDVSSKEDEQYRLVMQTDGNVVIYTSDNKATWATNTRG